MLVRQDNLRFKTSRMKNFIWVYNETSNTVFANVSTVFDPLYLILSKEVGQWICFVQERRIPILKKGVMIAWQCQSFWYFTWYNLWKLPKLRENEDYYRLKDVFDIGLNLIAFLTTLVKLHRHPKWR